MRHVDLIVSDASDLIRAIRNAIDLQLHMRTSACGSGTIQFLEFAAYLSPLYCAMLCYGFM